MSVRQWSVSSPLPLSREWGSSSTSDLAVPWGFWGSSPGPATSPVLARRWRVRLREAGVQLGDSRPRIRAGVPAGASRARTGGGLGLWMKDGVSGLGALGRKHQRGMGRVQLASVLAPGPAGRLEGRVGSGPECPHPVKGLPLKPARRGGSQGQTGKNRPFCSED